MLRAQGGAALTTIADSFLLAVNFVVVAGGALSVACAILTTPCDILPTSAIRHIQQNERDE